MKLVFQNAHLETSSGCIASHYDALAVLANLFTLTLLLRIWSMSTIDLHYSFNMHKLSNSSYYFVFTSVKMMGLIDWLLNNYYLMNLSIFDFGIHYTDSPHLVMLEMLASYFLS